MFRRVPMAQVSYETAQTELDQLDQLVAVKQVTLLAAVELAQEMDRELAARRPYDPDWDGWVAAWKQANDLWRMSQSAYDVLVTKRAQQARIAALARRVLSEAHRLDKAEVAFVPWN